MCVSRIFSMHYLYESIYKFLNYFHCSLWANLEDEIPSQPVAVIKLKIAISVFDCKNSIAFVFSAHEQQA